MVMSDNNKYVNLYIENALGLVHQYLNDILQLKTQNKILDDLVSEKDQVIKSLENNLNQNTANNDEISRIRANANSMEEQYNAMKNKVSHMDTLLNQVADMKNIIREKDNIIVEKDNIIADLKNQATAKINKRRSKPKDVPIADPIITFSELPLNMTTVTSPEPGANDF